MNAPLPIGQILVAAGLIRRVKEYGLLSFPGAFTPSEIVEAYEAGADAVKVFPV